MSTKRKAPAAVAQPTVKPSAMHSSRTRINESKATVASSQKPVPSIETIEISSDSASSSDSSDAEEDAEAQGTVDTDADMADALQEPETMGFKTAAAVNGVNGVRTEEEEDEANSDAEPTFGELVQAQGTIYVSAALSQPTDINLQTHAERVAVVAPSISSLSTVLAQALRTDDSDLLESCLQTTQSSAIRNTVERLDSGLVGTLLSKLAVRLHRRPGRAGSLMVWVQWAIIAHGGALASQPDVMSKLQGLQKVLAERARGLNSLLVLKGKLDLLDAQMKLRRRAEKRQDAGDRAEAEAGLIYVEGEEQQQQQPNPPSSRSARARRGRDEEEEEEDADEGMLPATNGIIGDSDDEEDEEDSDDEEESSNEDDAPDDEDEVDFDDVDDAEESLGEDEDSDLDAPPPKLQKVGAFAKRR